MSLYNMLFGRNGKSDLLLAVIGFREVDVERFRDVHVEGDGEVISVYTRTGGGNRSDYPQKALYASPLFKTTYDDEFDSTYGTFDFDVPAEFVEDVRNLSNVLKHGLRAEFAQHLAKTLNRAPTEADRARAEYDAERAALNRLRGKLANGHTFVPYDDSAMERALELAEANDGKLRSAWGILPLAMSVNIHATRTVKPRDKPEYVEWTRFQVHVDRSWRIDEPYWAHCQERFGAAYPKAMARVAEGVERERSKAA